MRQSVHEVRQALMGGLSELTIGAIEGQQRVEAEQFDTQGTEMFQRIHVPLKGVASRKLIYSDLYVNWPYPIINQLAGGQHESSQDTPHFTSGVEVLTEEHVMVDAQVREWVQDDSDFYTGARMRLIVWVPDAPKPVPYEAVLHLGFIGYAAPADDDTDDAQNLVGEI